VGYAEFARMPLRALNDHEPAAEDLAKVAELPGF